MGWRRKMRKVANKFCRYRKSVYICEPKRPGAAPRGARAISGGGLRRAKGAEKVPEVLEKVPGGLRGSWRCWREKLKGAFRERNGLMAEWLGKGLQNLVQRFESASDLRFVKIAIVNQ